MGEVPAIPATPVLSTAEVVPSVPLSAVPIAAKPDPNALDMNKVMGEVVALVKERPELVTALFQRNKQEAAPAPAAPAAPAAPSTAKVEGLISVVGFVPAASIKSRAESALAEVVGALSAMDAPMVKGVVKHVLGQLTDAELGKVRAIAKQVKEAAVQDA